MIKISIRDLFADLPPSVLKKRIQEIDQRKNDITNFTEFKQFTPEVIAKFKELFSEGKINSRPVLNSTTEYLSFDDINGEIHRDNNLPARLWGEGGYSDSSKEYYKHGKVHRTDGPAIRNDNDQFIVWAIDGKRLLQYNQGMYIDIIENKPITKEEYIKKIMEKFPNAKKEFLK